jgi:FAD/FMN-containing dehydrogenase
VNPATAPSAIADLSRAVRELPFAPFACELISRGMAQRLGLASRVTLLVRLGGNAVAVAAQTDAFRALGAVSDVPDEIWHALRAADSESVATWRWSARPARFAGLWRAAHELRQDEVLAHGSPARGVVRLIGLGGSAARLASAPPPEAGGVVVERLAPQEWGAVPLPPPDPLARAVRERFDPDGVLNPGILGDFS